MYRLYLINFNKFIITHLRHCQARLALNFYLYPVYLGIPSLGGTLLPFNDLTLYVILKLSYSSFKSGSKNVFGIL